MHLLRIAVLVLLTALSQSLFAADPRDGAIAEARANLKQPANGLLSSLCFVVIGYEGNLPLFKAGTVPPPQNGTGIATPIDCTGYFLAPAHSVLTEHPMYIMGNFRGKLTALKAEIVYRGNPAQTETDYSILKVKETLSACVSFASDLPKEGEKVYTAVRLQSQIVLAEGSCQTVPRTFSPAGLAMIMTDIPVVAGDSGGPLLTSDLKFIGLTSRGGSIWSIHRTQTCCPSERVLRSLIEQHKTKQPPAAPAAP